MSLEGLPPALTIRELAGLLRVSRQTAYEWQRQGKLERFELRPRLGWRHHRYSRLLVEKYLAGEPTTPGVIKKVS